MSPKMQKIVTYLHPLLYGGVASAFFGIFQGRCTFFALAFSAVGCYGWLVLGRDLTSFALFAGAIQALLVVHSGKEDWQARKNNPEPEVRDRDAQ